MASTLNLSRLPEFDEAVAPSLLSRTLIATGLKIDPMNCRRKSAFWRRCRGNSRSDRRGSPAPSSSGFPPKTQLAAEVPNAVADAYVLLQPSARIVERAVAPSKPYFPKIIPIVAAAFVASLLIMAGMTLLRDASGRARRRAADAAPAPVTHMAMPTTSHAPGTGPENLPGSRKTRFAEDFPSFDSAGPTPGLEGRPDRHGRADARTGGLQPW